jgi:hypothetical protein
MDWLLLLVLVLVLRRRKEAFCGLRIIGRVTPFFGSAVMVIVDRRWRSAVPPFHDGPDGKGSNRQDCDDADDDSCDGAG